MERCSSNWRHMQVHCQKNSSLTTSGHLALMASATAAMTCSTLQWLFCIFQVNLWALCHKHPRKQWPDFSHWWNTFHLIGSTSTHHLDYLLHHLYVIVNPCFISSNVILQKLSWIIFKHGQTLLRNVHLSVFLGDC